MRIDEHRSRKMILGRTGNIESESVARWKIIDEEIEIVMLLTDKVAIGSAEPIDHGADAHAWEREPLKCCQLTIFRAFCRRLPLSRNWSRRKTVRPPKLPQRGLRERRGTEDDADQQQGENAW